VGKWVLNGVCLHACLYHEMAILHFKITVIHNLRLIKIK